MVWNKEIMDGKGQPLYMESHLLVRCPPLGGAGWRCRARPLHDERPCPVHWTLLCKVVSHYSPAWAIRSPRQASVWNLITVFDGGK